MTTIKVITQVHCRACGGAGYRILRQDPPKCVFCRGRGKAQKSEIFVTSPQCGVASIKINED